MFKYILLGFTIYFAYRFIVNFLIPVVKTTRQVKKQFDSVREQQAYQQQQTNNQQQAYQQQANNQQKAYQQQAQASASKKSTKASDEDYLEFEEIK
jgi:type II secretory pathway component PulM